MTKLKLKPDEGTDGWCTPEWLADDLGPFHLDPCSNTRSHIRSVITCLREEDGLTFPWHGSVFVNCPYSNVMPWA